MKGAMSELQIEFNKGRRALGALAREFASYQLRSITAAALHLKRAGRGKPLTL